MPPRIDVAIAPGAAAEVKRQRDAGGIGGARELKSLVRRAVLAALADRGVKQAEISVTLLGDDEIAELNHRFLDHEGATDVISFPLYEEGEPVVGDIYIGLAQASRQAASYGAAIDEEIGRLAVHGTLHVLGFDHPEGEEREGTEMWQVQEAIVRGMGKS